MAAIQAQLNNLGREIKKVNEKVYAAQVGCEPCKGPHYTKDFLLKEEGKTLEEAYYTQFGAPFQGGGYRAAAPGFYQRNNANPSFQERRQSMKETMRKFMGESAKSHEENSKLIKEIQTSTDAAIRNQGASIKTLEIQIGLREIMELDLEARLMGETLVINRSLDLMSGDYIELNDLNKALELRRNQVKDLMPTVEEGEVIDAPMDDLVESRNDELDAGNYDYPRALMNVPIIVGTFSVIADFAVLEDRDAFRDKGMEFALMLDIPYEGACVFTDRWSLDELAYGVPKDGPYPNHHPSPYDIISYIQNDREGQVTRIHHEEEIEVQDYQILTCEIVSTLKPLEEIMWENVFCLEGNRDHVISYGMLLTLLVKKRKTRKDRGTRRGRHSTSSSTFDQPSSSHLNYDDDDDGNDEGTSRASTPSPTRFVNSLTNDVP
ncbi:hypothetical protein Tco_0255999 [Tanacetum coccineum]